MSENDSEEDYEEGANDIMEDIEEMKINLSRGSLRPSPKKDFLKQSKRRNSCKLSSLLFPSFFLLTNCSKKCQAAKI